jgi:hypothetical protein
LQIQIKNQTHLNAELERMGPFEKSEGKLDDNIIITLNEYNVKVCPGFVRCRLGSSGLFF